VKLLFLVHNLGKTRHFENVIVGLARRGHWVTLAAARKRKKPLKLTGTLHAEKRIDVVPCPVHRVDKWEPYVRPLRQARDYLRFLDPAYTHTAKLSARASGYAPPGWTAFLNRPVMRRRWRIVRTGLELAEALIPSDRYFELFLRSEQPDVVLVTPLVDFGSYQTDYVKAAHRLGIPVAFLPFSWDNLTNRGLVRVSPDRALVWSERQKLELVRFHGVSADRIVITGAPRFDDFFAMSPSNSRVDFLRSLALPCDLPLLLYLCSSNFVAPEEVPFIQRWVREIRCSPDQRLKDAAILVRPHPANADQWEGANVSGLGPLAVWPHHSSMNADQGLYDSIHHADAVVGLNTSAMIEAGILGKPVFTIRTAEFAGGQGQTLHFHYLLASNGGLVEASEDFAGHLRLLVDELAHPGRRREQSLRFVEAFVRPHGLAKPASPIMIEAIEDLHRVHKRKQSRRAWMFPLRWALLSALRRRTAATRATSGGESKGSSASRRPPRHTG
jgi:hypothetical protein